jgi:hypothetical protein
MSNKIITEQGGKICFRSRLERGREQILCVLVVLKITGWKDLLVIKVGKVEDYF